MTFEIAHIWVFALFPLPLIITKFFPPLRKRRSALLFSAFYQIAEALGEKPGSSAWISRRNWVNWVLLWLVWFILLGSLSHPQLVGEPEMTVKISRSFIIAVDISFSMDTRDWVMEGERVSRWEAVKHLMNDFIERRHGDRMGLIFFGTNAYLQAPLTPELNVVQWQLGETEVGMAGQMTGIGNAIGYAVKMFQVDTLEQKVLLLLTDGVDSGSDVSPLDAANLAKVDSVTIYTLGIGEPYVPGTDLDERTLKEMAEVTGGSYFSVIDPEQLEAVYTTIDRLEPLEWEEEQYKPTVSLYHYPLAVALVLILVHQLLMALIRLISTFNKY
ncbi:VWA domain-containing protein [Marinilabiliaceae bacterium JC017]|nr:VWA domain-containing protein [Marinilabiliaceae bacterium JC017]